MQKTLQTLALLIALFVLSTAAIPAYAVEPYDLIWTRGYSPSTVDDYIYGVAVDNTGKNYAVGCSGYHVLYSYLPVGDIIIVAHDADGNLLWLSEEGTECYDAATCVDVDADGNVYVAGGTKGALPGYTNTDGVLEAFIMKYDKDGVKLWNRQYATDPSTDINVTDIVVDTDGSIYLAGHGDFYVGDYGDTILNRYDSSGVLLWSKHLTMGVEDRVAIAADGNGGIYLTGTVDTDFGGNILSGYYDALLAKFNTSGDLVWSRLLGTEYFDSGVDVVVCKDGNICISGNTYGILKEGDPGNYNIFVAKFDPSGNMKWIEQKGANGIDTVRNMATDSSGKIYVTVDWQPGYPEDYPPYTEIPAVLTYDSDGTFMSVWPVSKFFNGTVNAFTADSTGGLYIAGNTYDTPSTGSDIMVLKGSALPCASNVTNPKDGAALRQDTTTITGESYNRTNFAVNLVEVSTDGGQTWHSGYDSSGVGDWSSWGYDWTLPELGIHKIRSRASNTIGQSEPPRDAISVTVDGDMPHSTISNPFNGVKMPTGLLCYSVKGDATDLSTPVAKVEVSISGGPWQQADGTSNWHYSWPVPPDGIYTIQSRATDSAGNVETPEAGVSVEVDNCWITVSRTQAGGNNTLSARLVYDSEPAVSAALKFYYSTDGGLTWQKKGGGRTLADGTLTRLVKLKWNGLCKLKAAYEPKGRPPVVSDELDCDLTPVTALTPADGTITAEESPTATWEAFPGATGYVIQTCSSKGFKKGVVETADLGLVTSGQLPALAVGQSVYWRVVALIPEGRSVGSVPRKITRN